MKPWQRYGIVGGALLYFWFSWWVASIVVDDWNDGLFIQQFVIIIIGDALLIGLLSVIGCLFTWLIYGVNLMDWWDIRKTTKREKPSKIEAARKSIAEIEHENNLIRIRTDRDYVEIFMSDHHFFNPRGSLYEDCLTRISSGVYKSCDECYTLKQSGHRSPWYPEDALKASFTDYQVNQQMQRTGN